MGIRDRRAADPGAYLAATAAVAGDCFPGLSRFRGGKGVATPAGALAADPAGWSGPPGSGRAPILGLPGGALPRGFTWGRTLFFPARPGAGRPESENPHKMPRPIGGESEAWPESPPLPGLDVPPCR